MSYRKGYFENNSSNSGWYECVRCGKKLRKGDAEIDHIIPKSRGGSNRKTNLQCMCVTCNRSKGNSVDANTASDLGNSIAREGKNILSSLFGKK